MPLRSLSGIIACQRLKEPVSCCPAVQANSAGVRPTPELPRGTVAVFELSPGRLPEVEDTVAGTPNAGVPRLGPPKRRRSGSFVMSRSLPISGVRWLAVAMMVKLKPSDFHPPPAQTNDSSVPLAHR